MKPEILWRPRRPDSAPLDFLLKEGNLLGQWFWARGLEDTDKRNLVLKGSLTELTSPFALKNMRESAQAVVEAVCDPGQTIAIYSDYDMDGMSGLAILKTFLETVMGKPVVGYHPNRLEEGYGVHPAALEDLKNQGVSLVITVDTGIGALHAAKKAKELGLTLVITDHHKQILDELPDTPFIVNPNQKSDTSGLSYVSGAGIAFYLCLALRALLREQGYFLRRSISEPRMLEWLDLFVLGTIADVVDLVKDNRILVRAGLEQLAKSQRPGLRALMELAIRDFPNLEITAKDVAFSLTPKLNAASRMGQAALSAEILTTADDLRARELAEKIMELNSVRAKVQGEIFDVARQDAARQIAEFNPPVVITYGDWHEGVLGVVAAKLVEEFRRTAIVLTQKDGMLRGSMRGCLPLSCVKLLDSVSDVLLSYGGHKQAAGLKLSKENLPGFMQRLWENAGLFYKENPMVDEILFDGFIEGYDKLNVDDVDLLHKVGNPWGQGNPEALFLLKMIPIEGIQPLKDLHVRCQFSGGISMIGFFKLKEFQDLKTHQPNISHFDALLTPEINRFRGKKSVQLNLKHVRPSQTFDFDSGPRF